MSGGNGHDGGCRLDRYRLKTRRDFPDEIRGFPLTGTGKLAKILEPPRLEHGQTAEVSAQIALAEGKATKEEADEK
jgi:hypothetical protein